MYACHPPPLDPTPDIPPTRFPADKFFNPRVISIHIPSGAPWSGRVDYSVESVASSGEGCPRHRDRQIPCPWCRREAEFCWSLNFWVSRRVSRFADWSMLRKSWGARDGIFGMGARGPAKFRVGGRVQRSRVLIPDLTFDAHDLLGGRAPDLSFGLFVGGSVGIAVDRAAEKSAHDSHDHTTVNSSGQ